LCSTNHSPESLVLSDIPSTLALPARDSLAYPEWMMLADSLSYFPGDIMAKVDRASMAASLETRTPFTDPDLIALAWQLPMRMKIRNGQGKWLLREVLHRYVPKALTERPKAGFAVPISQWLRGELRHWAEELLAENKLRHQAFLNPATVQRLWNTHQSG